MRTALALLLMTACTKVPPDAKVVEPPPWETREGRQEARLALIDGLLDLERTETALELMRVAEEDGARDATLDPLRGEALYQLGLYDQAEELLRRAIDRNDANPRPWRILGLVLADTDRPDEAIEALRRAVELDDQDAASWNNLGFMLFAVKEDPASIGALTRAVTLEPGNDRYRRNLAFALFEHGNRDQAWSAFQAADPPADAWYHYGLAYERVDELDEARQKYEETLQLQPDHTRAREAIQRIAAFGSEEAP